MGNAGGTAVPMIVEQRWDLQYTHTADAVTTDFLRTLRDDGKIIGVTCPECERVLVPPREMCDRDFCETGGRVELPLVGTLELFTIMHLAVDGLPEPPYVLAYVRPDGANTALPGVLHGVDLSGREVPAELAIGKRVEIVVADERRGRITDLTFALAD
jgi:uncharacterized OB-fold protein